MKILSVYNDMDITYNELDTALDTLGYKKKKERTKDSWKEEFLGEKLFFFRYSNEQLGSSVYAAYGAGKEFVPKHQIVSISEHLRWQGLIDGFDDLAKMIEKNREPKLKRA